MAPALVLVALTACGAAVSAASGATFKPQGGDYSGQTKADDLIPSARTISFTVKVKRRTILLTNEPIVRRDDCLSPPAFLLGQDSVSTTLSRSGEFTFRRPTFSLKVDKIAGSFVQPDRIEGKATYNFQAQDLCTAGKKTVNFTAKPGSSTTTGG